MSDDRPIDDAGPEHVSSTLDAGDGSSLDALLHEVAALPIAPPPEPDRTGQRLAQYRIASKLGEGGMGVVYAAEDLKLRRTVALKVLPLARVGDPQRRRRFLREARSASAVSHPNVATVFDVGEAEGTIYIAMERVEGNTLRAILEQAGAALPVLEAVRIAGEVARGLAKAHEAGVIHRDLKPENLMLGDEGLVKILDFGLAKLRGAALAVDAMSTESIPDASREGVIVGTPSYMSPEQAKGADVDPRSDVFSLGVVLYEMLAGARPFTGTSAVGVLIAIDRDEPVPIGRRNPAVSARLQRIVKKCLEKERDARYPSCRELADDLGRLRLEAAESERGGPRRAGVWIAGGIGLAGAALGAVIGAARVDGDRPAASTSVPTDEPRAQAAREAPRLPPATPASAVAGPEASASAAVSAAASSSTKPPTPTAPRRPRPAATPAPAPDPLSQQK